MTTLAWFIFSFILLQFAVAIVNLIFSQSFPQSNSGFNNLVSVLIPARNEEKNIGHLLTDLISHDYKNIEILVFNDQSTDKTAEIITGFSQKDARVKLINSEVLPEGWLGKNHACHSLSKLANGRYLLFLDSDVRIGNGIIQQTCTFSDKHKLGLLSIFPRQIMVSTGEKAAVPLMYYILLTLLPLILVRKTGFSSLAAANGQFMLFNAEVYKNILPHEKMKSDKVEDIKIARYYKNEKIKIACITGKESVSCRMYSGFLEAVHGFSKNVTQFFGNSFSLAILFWLVTTFGFIIVFLTLSKTIFIFYLSIFIFTRITVSVAARQSVLMNLIFLIPQQLALGLFVLKALVNRYKKQYEWKGRNIS
jgi:glycosyltransferase involved in cell wall biosynthesis